MASIQPFSVVHLQSNEPVTCKSVKTPCGFCTGSLLTLKGPGHRKTNNPGNEPIVRTKTLHRLLRTYEIVRLDKTKYKKHMPCHIILGASSIVYFLCAEKKATLARLLAKLYLTNKEISSIFQILHDGSSLNIFSNLKSTFLKLNFFH